MGYPKIVSVTSVEADGGGAGVCLELTVDRNIDEVLARVLEHATTPMAVVEITGEKQTISLTVFDREHIPAALTWLLAAGMEELSAEADAVREGDAQWLASSQALIDTYVARETPPPPIPRKSAMTSPAGLGVLRAIAGRPPETIDELRRTLDRTELLDVPRSLTVLQIEGLIEQAEDGSMLVTDAGVVVLETMGHKR